MTVDDVMNTQPPNIIPLGEHLYVTLYEIVADSATTLAVDDPETGDIDLLGWATRRRMVERESWGAHPEIFLDLLILHSMRGLLDTAKDTPELTSSWLGADEITEDEYADLCFWIDDALDDWRETELPPTATLTPWLWELTFRDAFWPSAFEKELRERQRRFNDSK